MTYHKCPMKTKFKVGDVVLVKKPTDKHEHSPDTKYYSWWIPERMDKYDNKFAYVEYVERCEWNISENIYNLSFINNDGLDKRARYDFRESWLHHVPEKDVPKVTALIL